MAQQLSGNFVISRSPFGLRRWLDSLRMVSDRNRLLNHRHWVNYRDFHKHHVRFLVSLAVGFKDTRHHSITLCGHPNAALLF
jgi:hypothetical protein